MDTPAQQVKDKLNIVDVVGQYVSLKRAGRTYTARCPFHNEKTPSFHVSPERGTYKCFGCGEGGDIFTFVEKMEGVDFPTALKQLAQRAGVEIKQDFSHAPEHKEHDEKLREVCEEATTFFESVLKTRQDVVDYLHSRGVHDETIAHWRLGFAPANWSDASAHLVGQGFSKDDIADAGLASKSEKRPGEIFDRFRGRIMFPIFDPNGRVIAFSARYFEAVPGSKEEGEPAKYVNSPETALFKKSKTLYGFDRAKNAIRKADCILLVEGQFDLVLSHQSGLPFTVALSGTALTPEHLSLLSRLSKRLVLALDADSAGVRAGLRSAEMALRAGFDVKVPTFPEGKDPADIARENPELLKAAIRTSRTAVEFFLEALRPAARDDRAYKKVVETNVLPLIAAIGSKIDQEHFVRIVAQKLGVSEAAVLSEVNKKPRMSEVEEEAPISDALANQIAQTPLERAIAMLALHFKAESPERIRLIEVVGEPRVTMIEQKCTGEEERLRFEFDLLGEEEVAVVEGLFHAIERKIIQEKLALLQGSLRTGSEADHGFLLREIATLKRREQELRK
jgi:DNA primase